MNIELPTFLVTEMFAAAGLLLMQLGAELMPIEPLRLTDVSQAEFER